MDFFKTFLKNFKWFTPEHVEFLINKLISILITIAIMYIVIKIGNSLIKKFVDRQVASKKSFSLDPQKAITIGEVLKSVLKYIV